MKKLFVVMIVIACLGLAGCGAATVGQSGGTVVQTAKDNAGAIACAANRAQIDRAYATAQSTSGTRPVFEDIVAQVGAKCPSGGKYFWDTTTNKTRCSIHGQ